MAKYSHVTTKKNTRMPMTYLTGAIVRVLMLVV
jgi:hypothetical protein